MWLRLLLTRHCSYCLHVPGKEQGKVFVWYFQVRQFRVVPGYRHNMVCLIFRTLCLLPYPVGPIKETWKPSVRWVPGSRAGCTGLTNIPGTGSLPRAFGRRTTEGRIHNVHTVSIYQYLPVVVVYTTYCRDRKVYSLRRTWAQLARVHYLHPSSSTVCDVSLKFWAMTVACRFGLSAYYGVFDKKLKNVSGEYDRLNDWNSTLQAAWYIRHVRWTCLFHI